MIYLDNGATTYPKPQSVINAVNNAMKKYSFNPGRGGYYSAARTAEMVFGCRSKVAAMFGCTPDRVVFTPNCTTALNICIKGLFKPGDHIICSSLEHNAVMRPLNTLRKQGASVEVAEVIFGDSDATARSFERLIKPGTKGIICTHASNVTGTVLPIEKIGKLCRERGIRFIVDAAQSAGILPINVETMCVDYLCIAAHKGLYAPLSVGALICAGDCPTPLTEGGTGNNSLMLSQPDELPERLESGTLPVPLIAGLSAGVDFVNQRGIDRIYCRELSLIKRAYDGLSRLSSVNLYAPRPAENKCVPVLSFNVRGRSSGETGEFLAENGVAVRAGLHCAPTAHKHIGTLDIGTVRIVPSVFTKDSDIDTLLQILKNADSVQKNARKY